MFGTKHQLTIKSPMIWRGRHCAVGEVINVTESEFASLRHNRRVVVKTPSPKPDQSAPVDLAPKVTRPTMKVTLAAGCMVNGQSCLAGQEVDVTLDGLKALLASRRVEMTDALQNVIDQAQRQNAVPGLVRSPLTDS